jgi:2-oxoglutarate dehydrogenase complex dehydrogenase (E1) component-like enzyme
MVLLKVAQAASTARLAAANGNRNLAVTPHADTAFAGAGR